MIKVKDTEETGLSVFIMEVSVLKLSGSVHVNLGLGYLGILWIPSFWRNPRKIHLIIFSYNFIGNHASRASSFQCLAKRLFVHNRHSYYRGFWSLLRLFIVCNREVSLSIVVCVHKERFHCNWSCLGWYVAAQTQILFQHAKMLMGGKAELFCSLIN